MKALNITSIGTPQIAALEAILRFEELCRTMDPWKC